MGWFCAQRFCKCVGPGKPRPLDTGSLPQLAQTCREQAKKFKKDNFYGFAAVGELKSAVSAGFGLNTWELES
jgi:hypothetical protein